MAMKPYSEATYGQSYFYGNGWSTVGNYVVANRRLGNVYTVSGNGVSFNPHTYEKIVDRGYTGRIDSYSGSTWNSSRIGVMPYPYNWSALLPAGFNDNARLMALAQAYEKLRGNVDVSVDLVQWRQTLKMVSIYRRLVRGIAMEAKKLIPKIETVKALKRELTVAGTGRRAKRVLRKLNSATNNLAKARLEYMYGWRPSAMTLYELAQQAINPASPGLLVCEGKGKVERSMLIESGAISPNVPVKHFATLSDKARVRLYFTPQPSVMGALAKISSLNPASVLYELTPYSFVLDWMWDIGGWLRTLETAFLHRNDFVGGWQDLTKRYQVSSLCSGVSVDWGTFPTGGWTLYALKGEGTLTARNRSAINNVPYPARPTRQFEFGTGTMLNAIALAKVTLLDADALLAQRRR